MPLPLDVNSLLVSTFEPLPNRDELNALAARGEIGATDDSTADTFEYYCLVTTLLAEDCFGPTESCPLNTADECPCDPNGTEARVAA